MIEYELVRSSRKTIAIQLKENAKVLVRAPLKEAKKNIDAFVYENEAKILEVLANLYAKDEERRGFCLTENSHPLLLGEPCSVKIGGKEAGFNVGEEPYFYLPKCSQEERRTVMVLIYKQIALKELRERVEYFAKKMGVHPASVRVNSAKTRWGSCSGSGGINFSWRLITAPSPSVDYVVVHELAHMKEHNHSARFWTIVASVLPDYIERREALKAVQDRLSREMWD